MRNKEDPRTDNKGTEVKTTAVEMDANRKIQKRTSYQAMNQKISKQVYTTSVGIEKVLKYSTWMKTSQQETTVR